MRLLRYLVPAAMVLAGLNLLRAGEPTVLVAGDPPLTRAMADDYGRLAAWRLGPDLGGVGGPDRLRQMIVNDWANGDRKRQAAILADLKWWREEFPKLDAAERDRLAAAGAAADRARRAEQVHRLQLRQWDDARQQQVRALSNLQARHHETMMVIIGNLRPTGRYVYNPSTGKHDRYLSD